MKTMTRKQLAYYAGVDPRTLRKWMQENEEELRSLGMPKGKGALPPSAINWIIDKYAIDVPK